MNDAKPVVVVESGNEKEFEGRCDELIQEGYEMKAASCGFLNSEAYNFSSSYQAIFVKREAFPRKVASPGSADQCARCGVSYMMHDATTLGHAFRGHP